MRDAKAADDAMVVGLFTSSEKNVVAENQSRHPRDFIDDDARRLFRGGDSVDGGGRRRPGARHRHQRRRVRRRNGKRRRQRQSAFFVFGATTCRRLFRRQRHQVRKSLADHLQSSQNAAHLNL